MRFRMLGIFLVAAGALCGQPRPNGPPRPPAPPPPPRERGMPGGKWWDNPDMVKKLGLTSDQRKKMDDVFQQIRVKLIDLHAALDKEEAAMEPLMKAAQPDDSRIIPEIDRIAQARAELEKTEARLMLGLRHVLTPEQWEMLDAPPPGSLPHPPR